MDYSTILKILEYRFANEKDLIAFTYLEDGEDKEINITYSELYLEAQVIAASLLRVGKKGDRALLFYPSGLEFIKAFFGCLYAGIIAVPSPPPRMNRSLDRFKAIMTDCEAKLILTELSISQNKFFNSFSDQCNVIVTNTKESKTEDRIALPEVNIDDIAFLQYTSGSTGEPKGVIITHRNILANQELIKSTFNQEKGSIIIGWLPFYHDMGLIGNILQPIYSGNRSVLMSPQHFLQSPLRWLKAISKYRGTTSGGPNFAYDLCIEKIKEEELASLDLSCWKTAFSGAEPVKLSTLNKFIEKFDKCRFRSEAYQPCYGMAEATLLICGSDYGKGYLSSQFLNENLQFDQDEPSHNEFQAGQKDLVSCGRVTGFEVKIVDSRVIHFEHMKRKNITK